MRLASRRWGGRHHAGTVLACGRELTPLAVADPRRGMLPLLEALVRGETLSVVAGARLPVAAVTVRAPLPQPRRGLFCAGRKQAAVVRGDRRQPHREQRAQRSRRLHSPLPPPASD